MSSSRSFSSDGRVGAKTSIVSLTIIAISAALLSLILYAGISMNRASHAAQHALIETAISERINRTLLELKAWAWWDDGARAANVRPFPTEWFDHQYGEIITENHEFDEIHVLGPDDQPVFSYGRSKGPGSADLTRLLPLIEPMVREIRGGPRRDYIARDQTFGHNARHQRVWKTRSARWAANLLHDEKGPIIVSIMSIVPTIDQNLHRDRPPLLVGVLRIDQTTFDRIGESLKIEGLRFLPAESATPGATPLVGDDRQLIGKLTWQPIEPGRFMLTRLLPIVAILLLIATILSRLALRKLDAAYALLHEREASARFLAMHDGLSQLPNRRHFMSALRATLERIADRRSTARLCVAYVDVDRFKDVNDAIGHGAGDALVMQIGPRLHDLLRPDDLLARLGGDEFAVLRVINDEADAVHLGEAIMSAFRQPFHIDGNHLEVTASAGLAVAAIGERDPERLLQDADISLYKAKDRGRGRYALFERPMADEVRARHDLEVDLRAAIGTSQILMHYQPVVSTRTGKITSVEALVRWQHPRQGLIPPQRFIPIAEQSALMVTLGDQILEQVLRESATFRGIDIAINLSPMQLRQRELPNRLAQLARRFSVDPRRIVLEVTETMLVEANENTSDIFAEIRALGFRTALDDFGTGYSALGYLHQFEFDKIKIDRSFLSSGSLEKVRPILEGIVHIGRGLRMDIVAEGVESAAELAMITAMGCSEAQGFWISQPLALDQARAFIENQTVFAAAG
jgi:diguanylate cyclase (GGDEF)-like protein